MQGEWEEGGNKGPNKAGPPHLLVSQEEEVMLKLILVTALLPTLLMIMIMIMIMKTMNMTVDNLVILN
jgi:hypothetical protein